MGLIKQDIFICVDCETTGLDPGKDEIIEVAAVRFNSEVFLETYETLIKPEGMISKTSMAIHHITEEMVKGKPKIQEALPSLLNICGNAILIGHGISLDIAFLSAAAFKHKIPCKLGSLLSIDTLRLARLYGESPTNSLEMLRKHFNIPSEGAHRAMNDVLVNIEVFKFLAKQFTTTEELFARLQKPISLKAMPLGKHKGRLFSEIPLEYLQWAAIKDFDQDLLFSIRTELKKRRKGTPFGQAINPFSEL